MTSEFKNIKSILALGVLFLASACEDPDREKNDVGLTFKHEYYSRDMSPVKVNITNFFADEKMRKCAEKKNPGGECNKAVIKCIQKDDPKTACGLEILYSFSIPRAYLWKVEPYSSRTHANLPDEVFTYTGVSLQIASPTGLPPRIKGAYPRKTPAAVNPPRPLEGKKDEVTPARYHRMNVDVWFLPNAGDFPKTNPRTKENWNGWKFGNMYPKNSTFLGSNIKAESWYQDEEKRKLYLRPDYQGMDNFYDKEYYGDDIAKITRIKCIQKLWPSIDGSGGALRGHYCDYYAPVADHIGLSASFIDFRFEGGGTLC